jgi:hypothetical protein
LVTSRSFVVGLLKKKFFRHGYRKYEFPHNQGHNLEDPQVYVRQWIARHSTLGDLTNSLRIDLDPFVRAACLENPRGHGPRGALTALFRKGSHLERLALVRNPNIDLEVIEKIFDPDEQELGIDLKQRGELGRAFLTNEKALARVARDACIKGHEPFGSYIPYATPRAEHFLQTIWALASKWPVESWIPDWIYQHVPAPDDTKAEIYQRCSEVELRQTILYSCTECDERTLKHGVTDQDESCRAIACERIPCLDPELLGTILNGEDKARLQGLARNKTFYVNLKRVTGKNVTMREIPDWLRELGYGKFDTGKEETIFLLQKVRDRLRALDRDNDCIEIANETIERLREEHQKKEH